ncbi:hypothetical protein CYU10_001922 [Lactococcus lactis subsp. lactis]|uniref:Uncharacterized protein n=2 Tax=Lactococcus lactis TaxID=1358 RepID=A0A2N5WF54_LACLL|nr:hypothetical protein [Lactococcus lactis]PLW60874.1 hypothetical protein CYU10_001922 [Lactococcus lactis subsp. lactis]
MDIRDVMTTRELAEALNLNQAYVLRRAKEELEMDVDYRSTGKRSYIFAPSAYDKMKVKTIPKLIKAEMLPNMRIHLEFDNGESRFLSSQLEQDYFEKVKKLRNWAVGINMLPTVAWQGNESSIDQDGNLRMGGKTYTSQELYEKSTRHI